MTENTNSGRSQRESAEHEGYAKASRSFNRIWKERDSAQPKLLELNKRYVGDKFECIVIYGRRRVGKTALINEFCKDKPTIFFSALNTTGRENLEALSKSIMSFERPDMESAPEFRSYDAALDELTALSKEKRIVFVIDEYEKKYLFSSLDKQ